MRKFDARQPVRWLSPKEIVRGASGEFFGGLFSKYADNRDRQALSRRAEVYHHPGVNLPEPDHSAPLHNDHESEPPGHAAEVQGAVDAVNATSGDTAGEATPDGGLTAVPLHGSDEVWDGLDGSGAFIVDYVADIGDGFGATYAIAEAMARPQIDVDGASLNRGSVLILGGDQVYPVANELDYDNRTVGPYLLAYDEHNPADETIPVYAIPGNHDWYDGLDAFLRIFTNDGGIYRQQSRLKSVQSRSYFALALPHNWWIWGIDTGLTPGGRLDLRQVDYFRSVFQLMQLQDGPEPRVIACTAEPCWIKRKRSVDAQVRTADGWDHLIAFFECVTKTESPATAGEAGSVDDHGSANQRNPSDPPSAADLPDDHTQQDVTGRRSEERNPSAQKPQPPPWWRHVRLIISGDKHFYVRHQTDLSAPNPYPKLISSGGGGAYLSSTWEVSESVTLNMKPLAANQATEDGEPVTFNAEPVWPSRRTSLFMGLASLFKVPAMNPMLAALIGVLYGLFTYAFVAGQIQPTFRPDLAQRLSFVDQTAPEASERIPLVIALTGLDEACYTATADEAARCPETSVFTQLAFGSLENFGTFVVGSLMLGALWLFASAGYQGLLRTAVAWAFHGLLHGFAVALTIIISISIVIDRPSDNPFRLGPVWALLLIAGALLAVPILHRWARFRVLDFGGVGYALIPPLVIVALLELVGDPASPQTGAVAIVIAAAIVGGALGTFAITLYMVISQIFKVHLNELFAGIRSEKYKQFIRIVINDDQVDAYSIGYEKITPRTVNWDGPNKDQARITRADREDYPLRVDHVTVRR